MTAMCRACGLAPAAFMCEGLCVICYQGRLADQADALRDNARHSRMCVECGKYPAEPGYDMCNDCLGDEAAFADWCLEEAE